MHSLLASYLHLAHSPRFASLAPSPSHPPIRQQALQLHSEYSNATAESLLTVFLNRLHRSRHTTASLSLEHLHDSAPLPKGSRRLSIMSASDSTAQSIHIISKMWPTPPGALGRKPIDLEYVV